MSVLTVLYRKRVFHWASSLIASRWAVFGILCIVIFGNVSRRALYVLYEHCSRSTTWQSPNSCAMFPMLTALVAVLYSPNSLLNPLSRVSRWNSTVTFGPLNFFCNFETNRVFSMWTLNTEHWTLNTECEVWWLSVSLIERCFVILFSLGIRGWRRTQNHLQSLRARAWPHVSRYGGRGHYHAAGVAETFRAIVHRKKSAR